MNELLFSRYYVVNLNFIISFLEIEKMLVCRCGELELFRDVGIRDLSWVYVF